ncbi:MAG: protein-disulfide reductase DsbD domain-containing protein [Chitinophagales bacterium]
MKKNIISLVYLIFVACLFAQAQNIEPVKWKTNSEALGNNEFMLTFKATIQDGWYVYSKDVEEGGPLPADFDFTADKSVQLIGDLKEIGKAKEGFDPIFEMEVKKFGNSVTYKAKVKTNDATKKYEVPLLYMSCNDEACVRLEEYFNFTLKNEEGTKTITTTEKKPISPAKQANKTVVTEKTTVETTVITPAKEETKAVDEKVAETEAAPKKKKKKKKKKKSSKKQEILEPVKWAYTINKADADGEYNLDFTAKIDDGWYVYSQDIKEAEEGPLPTLFTFDKNEAVEFLSEKPEEISDHKKDAVDPIFKMRVKKYGKEVTFRQKVKMAEGTPITGNFRYMTCDDARCLFPQPEEFSFNKKAKVVDAATKEKNKVKSAALNDQFKTVITDCGQTTSSEESNTPWMIFFFGFLGGFAALFTPCVFPMIPLTVSFFTKQSKDRAAGIRNALIYALSIIVIYVALGFFVTATFGPDTLNALSTNPWFNLAFFAIFVIFAISFFGYFDIELPTSFVNKMDSMSDKGGLIGIFFMAFTLALVSFSCTGPIIGTLLVEAAVEGKQLGPILGMTGFAVALALPFALFAAFPAWLNGLPRAGGWLQSVKVVLGFIELIFALKFLSNADLVQQWGLLKRETFLIIWIILFVAMALYLIGRIRFPHDSPLKKISMPRGAFAVACVAFAIYLIPGIMCKSLPLVSGFPPPIFYSYGCGGGDHIADEEHIKDFFVGLEEAKKEGKPIFVDFTGWACVNCRKMEENVWPQVTDLLEEYTMVSLYVDEGRALPKEEQFEYMLNGKKRKVKTVGNKWSYLQTTCFATNTQPYYVLLNADGELLEKPVGYTPNTLEYRSFLENGLNKFESGKTASK